MNDHKNKMRDFDLEPGDAVRTFDSILSKTAIFEVTKIFPHIFEAKRVDNGMVRYFKKTDYMVGILNRYTSNN